MEPASLAHWDDVLTAQLPSQGLLHYFKMRAVFRRRPVFRGSGEDIWPPSPERQRGREALDSGAGCGRSWCPGTPGTRQGAPSALAGNTLAFILRDQLLWGVQYLKWFKGTGLFPIRVTPVHLCLSSVRDNISPTCPIKVHNLVLGGGQVGCKQNAGSYMQKRGRTLC